MKETAINDRSDETVICSRCDGSGLLMEADPVFPAADYCSDCGGDGRTVSSRKDET